MTALFKTRGAHVLVDGQYGSTGKGAFASFLAEYAVNKGHIAHFDGAISSNGPNSGHTSYFQGNKIVLKQLPTFGVHANLMGAKIPIYLSAGAIINPEVLFAEAAQFPDCKIFVHPNAAVVRPEDAEIEHRGSIARVAGTRSGTGSALIEKIKREPLAIAGNNYKFKSLPSNISILNHRIKPESHAYFMEVAQGFSLGINSHFYPKVTSRECTVMQACADARIPPIHVAVTYMVIRTYPIRVGNIPGHDSGGWYEDQHEINWNDIGQEPELTTVTRRVRRVATFSMEQLWDAVHANAPNWVAVNFLNYMIPAERERLLREIHNLSRLAIPQFNIIGGYGSETRDWILPHETRHA
jgi:adenylosuccinate synthase